MDEPHELKPTRKSRYSIRSKFKQCPRLVFYSSVAGIQPKRPKSPKLFIGSAFHEGLDKWRSGSTPDQAKHYAATYLARELAEIELNDDDAQMELARVRAYLDGYMVRFADDLKGTWESEKKMETDLEHGTVDVLWTDPIDGSIWIIEDKTRAQLTPKLEYVCHMNEQLLSYVIMARDSGIDVAGCIYRETKKTQLRCKKTETIDEYCQRVIDTYAEKMDDMYQEFRITFSQNQIDNYRREKDHMNAAVLMCLQSNHKFDEWGFNSESCVGKYGLCDFVQLCATQSDMIGRQYEPHRDNLPLDGGAFRTQIWGHNPVQPVDNVIELPTIEENNT